MDRTLGRFIDRVRLGTLVLALGCTVLGAAASYYALTKWSASGIVATGVSDQQVGLLDALYFSVVTVSSLGYGDYAPVGWARVLAGVEVFVGLGLISIMIAKVASERSTQLVKLIYTSDHERRINDFTDDVAVYRDRVRDAVGRQLESELQGIAERCRKLIEGMNAYVAFQSQVGMLTAGNKGSIRRLLKGTVHLAESVLVAAKQPQYSDATRRRLADLIGSLSRFSGVAEEFYDDTVVCARAHHVVTLATDFRRINQQRAAGHRSFDNYRVADLTEGLLARVVEVAPDPPWPKGVHKTVAAELGISNALASKALHHLVDEGRLHAEIDNPEEGRGAVAS